MYDYLRSEEVALEDIIDAAEVATLGMPENLQQLISYLNSDESAVRYWGATGLLILGDEARPAIENLSESLHDESPNVVVVAAEALYNLGEQDVAKKALLDVLDDSNIYARCHALNAIDCLEEKSPDLVNGVVQMMNAKPEMNRDRYDLRAARWLMEKWEVNPEEHVMSL